MSIDTNTYLMMCDQLETYYKVNNVDESSKKNLEKIYQMKKSNGIGQQNVKAYLIKFSILSYQLILKLVKFQLLVPLGGGGVGWVSH